MILHQTLNYGTLCYFEIGNSLKHLNNNLTVCWNHQKRFWAIITYLAFASVVKVDDIAGDLKHQVETPDLIHSKTHKDHKTKWYY